MEEINTIKKIRHTLQSSVFYPWVMSQMEGDRSFLQQLFVSANLGSAES